MKNIISKLFITLYLIQSYNCITQPQNFGITYTTTIQDKLPSFIKNIDYLGQGYNIFLGNPHSTEGLDSGYFNYSILEIEYEDDILSALTPDRSWIIPKGVRVNTYNACTTSYSSKQVSSMKSYRESLEASVNVRTRTISARFSASADYKQTNESIKSQESMFIESSAQCVQFNVSFYESKSFQPRLTSSMALILKNLEKLGDNEAAYHDFFDKYGTHVIVQMQLGSLFGYRFEMSVESVKKMKSKGISVTAAASSRCAKGSFGLSKDQESASAFEESTKTWKQYSVGALPDPDNNVSKWATQSLDNPMPVQNSLVSFDELLSIFTKRDNRGLTPSEISNLKRRFNNYIDTYCQNRLLVNGDVTYCEDSDAKINDADLEERFNTFFDKLIMNGRQNVLIMNQKSNRFLKSDSTLQNLKQFYYDGNEQFQFQFVSTDASAINTYYIKQVSTGKCIQPNKCSFNDKEGVIFSDCNNSLCQVWQVQEENNTYNQYRIFNKNSGKYLTVRDREEGENVPLMQYKNHDCDGCNVFIVWIYSE